MKVNDIKMQVPGDRLERERELELTTTHPNSDPAPFPSLI